MKIVLNKKTILITSVALLLLVTVGTTLAYVFTRTDPVENKFNPSKVSCAVVENKGNSVSGGIQNTGNSKTNVQIKNTGDTDAYVRVAVVVNWMSEDGTKVWATKPVKDTDYTISFNLSDDGWIHGSDGYYYYTKAVPAVDDTSTPDDETLTGVLIREAKLIGDAPVGYYLSIEIAASAIQAKGMGAISAQEAWAKAQQQNG